MNKDIDHYLENLQLRNEFELLKLPLDDVMEFYPNDLEIENKRLKNLLSYTQQYLKHQSKEVMELTNRPFPPIFPGISPENDWLRFEKWINGEPTKQQYKDRLPDGYKIIPADELSDEQLVKELEKLKEFLSKSGYGFGLVSDLPASVEYNLIVESLEGTDLMGAGWVMDGCSGYCPGCVQRPWCKTGLDACWTEDEEAGKIHYPKELNKIVSAAPGSLEIIREIQKEHDEYMDAHMKSYDDSKKEKDSDAEQLPF